MRRLGFSERLPPPLQQWTDGGGGVVLGLVVSGDGLGMADWCSVSLMGGLRLLVWA